MKGMKVVSVSFEVSSDHKLSSLSKSYHYKTHLPLKEKDLVAVETQSGYGVAIVVNEEINNPQQMKLATRWVIAKLDTAAIEELKEKETKMVELKQKMEQRRQKLQELEVYRVLAKEDPEIASLLVEFDEIAGDQLIKPASE